MLEHRAAVTESGELETRRAAQRERWMWGMIDEELRGRLREHPAVRERLSGTLEDLHGGRITATAAALGLLEAFATTA